MNQLEIRELLGFYENELTNHLLPFWTSRCVDKENGGFFNCFDNAGKKLMSRDKYTWSQGRFVWIWAKLADMQSDTFTAAQKKEFLALAKNGRDFLYKHCLMGPDDWRCVFLMDEYGNPKQVDGYQELDMSVYADCFVINAFGKYAEVAKDRESWEFCKKLYQSALQRIDSGKFNTLPYPLSPKYRAHGIPMIFSNVCKEIYGAAQLFDPDFCPVLMKNLERFSSDIMEHFVDENNVLHEIITSDNQFFYNLFGQHANPGHTLEDMWFMVDAMDLLKKPEMLPKISAIAQKAFEIGWDQKYGGIYHFTNVTGGELSGDAADAADEAMMKQAFSDWGSKLWWVHSETLYTSLLLYHRTGDNAFLNMYQKTAEYTFKVFPNPDTEIREWQQIQTREGKPQDKVVALPVKDPYHLLRNMILIVELFYQMLQEKTAN